eukprot:3043912-Amphidinium_carterae.1
MPVSPRIWVINRQGMCIFDHFMEPLCTEAVVDANPDDAEAELPVRRGCGGAWRAFVHVNSKFAMLTSASIQDLASKYKQLTPEKRDYYNTLGMLARDASRAGGVTFPCWSNTAAWKRGGHVLHRQSLQERGHDRLEADMKDLTRIARLARREER